MKNNSFTIPKIAAKENKIEYAGAVVYHGFQNRIVGTLTKEEMIGLNLLSMKDMHGGALEFTFEGKLITFRIYHAKSKIKINAEDPSQLKINVIIGVEGGIAKVFGIQHLNNPKILEKIEKLASKKVWWLMIDILVGFLPDKLILICAYIAFIVPYIVYKVNRKLHQIGDPDWKKEEQRHS